MEKKSLKEQLIQQDQKEQAKEVRCWVICNAFLCFFIAFAAVCQFVTALDHLENPLSFLLLISSVASFSTSIFGILLMKLVTQQKISIFIWLIIGSMVLDAISNAVTNEDLLKLTSLYLGFYVWDIILVYLTAIVFAIRIKRAHRTKED